MQVGGSCVSASSRIVIVIRIHDECWYGMLFCFIHCSRSLRVQASCCSKIQSRNNAGRRLQLKVGIEHAPSILTTTNNVLQSDAYAYAYTYAHSDIRQTGRICILSISEITRRTFFHSLSSSLDHYLLIRPHIPQPRYISVHSLPSA